MKRLTIIVFIMFFSGLLFATQPQYGLKIDQFLRNYTSSMSWGITSAGVPYPFLVNTDGEMTVNFGSDQPEVYIRENYTEEATSQDLSVAALDYTTGFSEQIKLSSVSFRFSSAMTLETVSVRLDSASGANYDYYLGRNTLSAETESVFIAPRDLILQATDKLNIQCTNANLGPATPTVYVIIKGELK